MVSICLYFQVHQPYRLRPYTVFDTDTDYFDDELNARIARRVAERCYVPANAMLRDLIDRHEGRFRVTFSVTGTACEQLIAHAPEAIDGFGELARTGCVEFLAETDSHSLCALYNPDEFRSQVEMHRDRMEGLFGQRPGVFRNTELILSNDVMDLVAEMGFAGTLCDCPARLMGERSASLPYRGAGHPDFVVLVKDRALSDDVAFRFCDCSWSEWPLSPEKFARWVVGRGRPGPLRNLFMDYETIGEHHSAETGIFEFFEEWPDRVLAEGETCFRTCGEAMESAGPGKELSVPEPISWADTEQDLSAWRGNAMQENALQELYSLGKAVRGSGCAELLGDWRRLQNSDHFYYMSTKDFADGAVHRYFNPHESPYDAYIGFMNVLDAMRARLGLPGTNG